MFSFTLKDPNFLPHLGCDFELLIKEGESLFLTGENGIGKSTLLKQMSHSLENSFLLSQTPLDSFYDRSLSRFKEIFLKAYSSDLEKEKFETYWEAFGLKSKPDRLLSQLSGGERQSVKLAAGLSMKSQILLLDEPTQYLDQEKKGILFHFLKDLEQRGRSLVIVEHDLTWWKGRAEVLPLKISCGTLGKGEPWTIS